MDEKNIRERLLKLYMKDSKHSQYQRLPERLQPMLPEIECVGKYEKERWQYIIRNTEIRDKVIADIGGNIGYFSISAIESGANRVFYFDGNKDYSDFAQLSSEYLGYGNQIIVEDKYYDFEAESRKFDIMLCLNVLHHVGDDFGASQNVIYAKEKMRDYIIRASEVTKVLVLQIGYNWMGNISKPLFNNGTKKEQIAFIESCCSDVWKIRKIGMADRYFESVVEYKDVNNDNIKRKDSLGEFLNRPLFILERQF